MKIIKTKTLSILQFAQINQLWNEEYPIKLKDRFSLLLDDVENYNHYIIEDVKHNIIAWAVDFEKENEIRFSIIVDSKFKRGGLGSILIERLKKQNKLLYAWVINHNNDLKGNYEYYQSPIAFYLKNGFVILEGLRIENEMIKAVKIKWSLTPLINNENK